MEQQNKKQTKNEIARKLSKWADNCQVYSTICQLEALIRTLSQNPKSNKLFLNNNKLTPACIVWRHDIHWVEFHPNKVSTNNRNKPNCGRDDEINCAYLRCFPFLFVFRVCTFGQSRRMRDTALEMIVFGAHVSFRLHSTHRPLSAVALIASDWLKALYWPPVGDETNS